MRQPGAGASRLLSTLGCRHMIAQSWRTIKLSADTGLAPMLQCNGRGECNRGFCACHTGWYGHDCAQRRPGTPDSPGGSRTDLYPAAFCISIWQRKCRRIAAARSLARFLAG